MRFPQPHILELNQPPVEWDPRTDAAALSGQVFELQLAAHRTNETRLDKPAGSETITDFEKKNRVTVTNRGNEYEYLLTADGYVKSLFKTAATEQGLKDAQKQIDAMVARQVGDLEQRYGVTISKEGDYIGKMFVNAVQSSGMRDVYTRAPNLVELTGLQKALANSEPSTRDLNIHFLKNVYPKGFGVFAFYDSDPSGKPAVFLQPGVEDRKATERDRQPMAILSGNLDPETSIEGLVTHEIAHHHQIRMGWKKDEKIVAAAAEKMGWQSYRNAKNEVEYLLKSTELDAQGNNRLYMNAGPNMWILCNANGKRIDRSGNLVEPIEAVTITHDQMMKEAVVKPATPYFRDLIEMYAEALTLYRLNDDTRKHLLSQNRPLHDLVQEKQLEEKKL